MATKIMDGLFMGDAESSQDPEFIEMNKIMYVLNCAGRHLPNMWEMHGLRYLTFPWEDSPKCVLFDRETVVVMQVAQFIDEAIDGGDSILVHSLEGVSRCVAVCAAYFMYKFHWGFEKCFEFIASKRPDIAPNPGFMQQLFLLDKRLYVSRSGGSAEPSESERIRYIINC
ncbi:unnamed protein product [Chrysoparadoxa australica]